MRSPPSASLADTRRLDLPATLADPTPARGLTARTDDATPRSTLPSIGISKVSEGGLHQKAHGCAANIARGLGQGVLGAVVGAWPAVALVGSYELLMVIGGE